MLVNFVGLVTQYSDKSAQIERSQTKKDLHRNNTIGFEGQPLEIMFGYYVNDTEFDTSLYTLGL